MGHSYCKYSLQINCQQDVWQSKTQTFIEICRRTAVKNILDPFGLKSWTFCLKILDCFQFLAISVLTENQ